MRRDGRLGEDELAAARLHYVEEMPVGEIAVVLDRSRVAVKTMMFRARKKLLPLVGRWNQGEDEAMNDYEPIENDDRLAQRLRREARRFRPVFSAALHERVLAAIQAASAPATVRGRSGSRQDDFVGTGGGGLCRLDALAAGVCVEQFARRVAGVDGGRRTGDSR